MTYEDYKYINKYIWEYAINNGPGFNGKWSMKVRWSELCELLGVGVKNLVFG